MRRRPLLGMSVLGLVTVAGCSFDEAAMLGPSTQTVRADTGQIRVLRYTDDPEAGDDWIDVVSPAASVVVEKDDFREFDARATPETHRADRRRVFEAVGPGSSLLVEMNCVGCVDGIPAVAGDDVELHVWRFVVDDAEEPVLGPNVARESSRLTVRVGDYVAVVRPGSQGPGRVVALDSTVLMPVADDGPDEGPDLYVEVYLAVAPGDTDLTYRLEDRSDHTYPVSVR